MKTLLRHSLIFGAVLLSNSALAKIPESTAQEIVKAAHILESQADMQDNLFNDLGKEMLSSASAKESQQYRTMLSTEFANADVAGHIQTRLQKELNEDEAKFVLSFLNSDLGQQIEQLEKEANAIDSDLAVQKGKILLQDEEFKKFILGVDDAIGLSDLTFALAKPIFAAMVGAKLEEHSGGDENFQMMMYKEMLKEAKPFVIEQTQQILAYSYQALNKEQRDAFISFLQDPRSAKFSRIIMQETEQGTLMAFKNWLQKLGKLAA